MMLASSKDANSSRKRSRTDGSEEAPKKRFKEDVILPTAKISIETYFSLFSEEEITEKQHKEWDAFKKIIKEIFPSENISMDDSSYGRTVCVPQNVLEALNRIQYGKEDFDILKSMLKKWVQFIQTLHLLIKRWQENDLERENLLKDLELLISDDNVDLNLTEARGWNVLHIAAYCDRLNLLRGVKNRLLPSQPERYEKLLFAKTNNTERTPIYMAEKRRHEKIVLWLQEEQQETLECRRVAIFKELKFLKKMNERQRKSLYEQVKQFITNSGASILTDKRGLNFLHYAALFDAIKLVLLVKESTTPQMYKDLLCAKSKKQKKTPYDLALEHNKKSPDREQMLELLNPKTEPVASPPLEQCSGELSFFKPADMSMNALCQQLNECLAEPNIVFQIQQPASAEKPAYLHMPYFSENENNIDKFIQLLVECSIIAFKNEDDLKNPFIVVQGVEDKEKFLGNKDKLTRFAVEYLPTLAIPSYAI